MRLGPWTLVTSPGRVGREGGAPGPPRRLAGSPTGRGAPPPGGARTPAARRRLGLLRLPEATSRVYGHTTLNAPDLV